MHEVLERDHFFVKEFVGALKAANEFDVMDESGQTILHCREPNLGIVTKLLRFTDYKRNTPFEVHITSPDGRPVVRVSRGISILLSKVDVFDDLDQRIGGFRQRFSIGGAFSITDAQGQPVCDLKGNWRGWDFRFLAPDGTELAHVTKQWAGVGKELFTSADNYVLEIGDAVARESPVRPLILGAVMCIDMVLKE